jgi:hypothetical protein
MNERSISVSLDSEGKGNLKGLGGSRSDNWNTRLASLVASALPVNLDNAKACTESSNAVFSGILDINPGDPIEAMLIGQLIAANEAALAMYRRGWQQPSEYFEARTKYLALADKATRTVALLSERLDQHRSRGQQQIIVKHVTVNADQAVVADSVVTGRPGADPALSAAILTSQTERPMPILKDSSRPDPVPVGDGGRLKAK